LKFHRTHPRFNASRRETANKPRLHASQPSKSSGIQLAETLPRNAWERIMQNRSHEESEFLEDEFYEEDMDLNDLLPLPRNVDSIFGKDYA
jgi:hypothetical protein